MINWKCFYKYHELILKRKNINLFISKDMDFIIDDKIYKVIINIIDKLNNLKYRLNINISDLEEKEIKRGIAVEGEIGDVYGRYIRKDSMIMVYLKAFYKNKGFSFDTTIGNAEKYFENNGVIYFQNNIEHVLLHEIGHHLFGKYFKDKKYKKVKLFPRQSQLNRCEYKEFRRIRKGKFYNYWPEFEERHILHYYYKNFIKEDFAEHFASFVFLNKIRNEIPSIIFENFKFKFMRKFIDKHNIINLNNNARLY